MLPNSQHQPAFLAEFRGPLKVSRAITCDLGPPISQIRFWQSAVVALRTTVPETSIDEYGDFRRPKDEIRPARNLRVDPVPPNSTGEKLAPQSDLRLCMCRTDTRHVVRTNFLGVNVSHLRWVEHSSMGKESINLG
jgi:hypothetical protein